MLNEFYILKESNAKFEIFFINFSDEINAKILNPFLECSTSRKFANRNKIHFVPLIQIDQQNWCFIDFLERTVIASFNHYST